MKERIGIAGAIVFAIAVGPAAAAGVDGLWLVEDGQARIEIAPCGDETCGKIVWLKEPLDEHGEIKRDVFNPDPSLRSRTVHGLTIVRGFPREPNRRGVWKGGTIYDPESGKTYRCTIRLDGDDRLKLRGYVGITLFGRTTVWSRVEPAPD